MQEQTPRHVKHVHIQMFFETAFGEVPFSLGMLSTVFSYNGTALGISAFLEMF